MDLGLNGKRAMILGGSRGIGWYTARLLASEGCSVALCAGRSCFPHSATHRNTTKTYSISAPTPVV